MSKIDFSRLDIVAEIEQHTSTRLRPGSRSGKQFMGACPYDDCSVDTDGFIVWPGAPNGNHFYCRGCRRSGDIVKLIREIKGLTFRQVLDLLGLDNPYAGGAGQQPGQPVKRRGPIPATPEEAAELSLLQSLYLRARAALKHEKARAYLEQRAIPFDLAQELGLAYIPQLGELRTGSMAEHDLDILKRWQDRLIFPLSSPRGEGYTGRALAGWKPAMDESEHKTLLSKHRIPRYKTTYLTGCFPGQALQLPYITIVEGPFDALALRAGGIANSVATCGTSLDASIIPLSLQGALLAYDGDESGKKAAKQVYTFCRREIGFTPRVSVPPVADGMGKDWSERYRLHGRVGLAWLISPDFCLTCGAPSWALTEERMIGYCKQCWRAMGNAPEPGEGCAVCGDFIDVLDGGSGRGYCEACSSTRQVSISAA